MADRSPESSEPTDRSDPSEAGTGSDETERADGADAGGADPDGASDAPGSHGAGEGGDGDLDALRRKVEEKYDFDDFGPADMAEMSGDEWEAVFDADTWITGEELLGRVEQELKSRISTRDVFAMLERTERDGERVLLAYSDEGYAVVYPDGSVEGRGTVLRDVKPTVALCSMEEYDPPAAPENYALPDPEEVPEGSGELGNWMLQFMAGMQILVGVAILVLWLFTPLIGFSAGGGSNDVNIIPPIAAGAFLLLGLFLFATVANARLSDRFRAEEYRDRLRAVAEAGDRPAVHPFEDENENENEGGDGSGAGSEGGVGAAGPDGRTARTTPGETDTNDP
jgi:hypothetical protein